MKKTNYIKGKDGKFAGSIGAGKTSVPTPAPMSPVAPPSSTAITNPEPKNVFLGEFTFGSNVADPEAFPTAADWADGVSDAITEQPFETFTDDYLPAAHISHGPSNFYDLHLYHSNTPYTDTAVITYSARSNTAWVETYIYDTGDDGASIDLPQPYADAIKAEIKNRST